MPQLTLLPPELLALVVELVGFTRRELPHQPKSDSHSLSALSKTCHSLYKFILPTLYRNIYVKNPIPFVRTILRSPRLTFFVRDLYISHYPYSDYSEFAEDEEEEEEKDAESLPLKTWHISPAEADSFNKAIDMHCSNVETEFECYRKGKHMPWGMETTGYEFQYILITLAIMKCHNVERIALGVDNDWDFDLVQVNHSVSLSRLEEFSLNCSTDGGYLLFSENMAAILSHAPALRCCQMSGIEGFANTFQGVDVTELSIVESVLDAKSFANIIKSMPNLKRCVYSEFKSPVYPTSTQQLTPRALAALLAVGLPSLKYLSLNWRWDDDEYNTMGDGDLIESLTAFTAVEEICLTAGNGHRLTDAPSAHYAQFFPKAIRKIVFKDEDWNVLALAAVARNYYPKLREVYFHESARYYKEYTEVEIAEKLGRRSVIRKNFADAEIKTKWIWYDLFGNVEECDIGKKCITK